MRAEHREAIDSREQLVRDCRAKDTQLKKCRLYIDELRKGVSGSLSTLIIKSRCLLKISDSEAEIASLHKRLKERNTK
jgi:hypothetical protein